MHWQTTRFRIDLSRPLVMGIVNVTPDSFSDAGRTSESSAACAHCEALVRNGADILDIGGESTRPGATPTSLEAELRRVLPVLRHAVTLKLPISVDTRHAEVMRAALDLGVDIVNDVCALREPAALATLAMHGSAGVCLMHMRGDPATMQQAAAYDDVVAEVLSFLQFRVAEVEAAGLVRERIVVDPGIGFAKTDEHNLTLLARQREMLSLGLPLLVGWSRKRTLGQITGRPVGERVAASVAAALLAVERGACIVRVHDVAQTVDALAVYRAATIR